MRWKGKWSDITMSILKYFKLKGAKENSQKDLLELPDPSGSLSKEVLSLAITAANTTMVKSITAEPRKEYIKLTAVQQFQIGKMQPKLELLQLFLSFLKKSHPDLALTEPTIRRAKN